MMAILFFLFIFGLICTFSKIPPSKKLLSLFSHDLSSHKLIKDDHSSPNKSDVTRSSDRGINDLTGVFATFDKNNDGYITKQELRESLKNIGISAEERDVSEMVQRVDLNKDGLIDFNEFCELYEDVVNIKGGDDDEGDSTNTKDQDLKEAFDVFDENRDGLITVEELGLVLSSLGFSEGKKLEDCREMIRRVDIDGDGMVNFDEFKMMMKSGFGKLVSIT